MNLKTIEKRHTHMKMIKSLICHDPHYKQWWFVCDTCPWVDECEWAFDLYNVETPTTVHHSCLGMK